MWLIVDQYDRVVYRIYINADKSQSIKIGRSKQCDIQLDEDQRYSRVHAVIHVQHNHTYNLRNTDASTTSSSLHQPTYHITIQDHSKFGTFVKNTRLQK